VTEAEIEAAIATHFAAIDVLEALKQTSPHMSSAPATSAPAAARRLPIAKRRWELAARAFRRFPFEAHTVRRICASYPEWATRLTGGVWHVDADLFDEFAARVERGEASFAVSAKSMLSVANSASLDENEHIKNVLDREDDREQT
jgi:hypothetical protein